MAAAAIRPGARPDLTGFAVAILAHAALLWLLSRDREEEPREEPAAMEVSFVEEVGPMSSAPEAAAEPTPAFGEQVSPAEAAAADASVPAPVTPPVPEPVRPPVEMGERRRPDVTQNRVPVRPAPPPRVAERQPQLQPQPQRPVQRTPTRPSRPVRQGQSGPSSAEISRALGRGAPSSRPGPSAAAPAQLSGAERQRIVNQIGRLIQPCAARARAPNGFARGISVVLQVTVSRDGTPTGHRLISSNGADGPAGEYLDDVEAVAMRAVRACASGIASLPSEHYENGWRSFRYVFRFP